MKCIVFYSRFNMVRLCILATDAVEEREHAGAEAGDVLADASVSSYYSYLNPFSRLTFI